MYYTYMLRCENDSIYTGIAKDLERRMNEHFNREKNCAKYTKWHKAKKLECYFESDTRSNAAKLEYHIKRLTKESLEKMKKGERDFYL